RDLSPPRDRRAAVGRRLWLERQRDLRRRGWHVRRRDVQPLGPATARGATDMRVVRRRLSQWPRALRLRRGRALTAELDHACVGPKDSSRTPPTVRNRGQIAISMTPFWRTDPPWM